MKQTSSECPSSSASKNSLPAFDMSQILTRQEIQTLGKLAAGSSPGVLGGFGEGSSPPSPLASRCRSVETVIAVIDRTCARSTPPEPSDSFKSCLTVRACAMFQTFNSPPRVPAQIDRKQITVKNEWRRFKASNLQVWYPLGIFPIFGPGRLGSKGIFPIPKSEKPKMVPKLILIEKRKECSNPRFIQ